MRTTSRTMLSGIALAALLTPLLVALGTGVAHAGQTSVSEVHWTKSKLDVGRKAKRSNLKVRLADSDGVCSAAVGVSGPKGRYFTRNLYLDSGSNNYGMYSTGSESWDLSHRGRWRVTVVAVVDCDGHSYVTRRKSGIGSSLRVYSSRRITKVKLSSVPKRLTRGSTDVAVVRLRAGGRKVKRRTVSLMMCRNDSYSDCWRAGKAKTKRNGKARIRYRMPREDVLVYAAFRGSRKATRGFSKDRHIKVRWKNVRVGMSLTVTPSRAGDDDGRGTATVTFDRVICNGEIELMGDVQDWEWLLDDCTRSVTFDLWEPNFDSTDQVLSFYATLEEDGYGMGDSYTGRSNSAYFTVPGWSYA